MRFVFQNSLKSNLWCHAQTLIEYIDCHKPQGLMTKISLLYSLKYHRANDGSRAASLGFLRSGGMIAVIVNDLWN